MQGLKKSRKGTKRGIDLLGPEKKNVSALPIGTLPVGTCPSITYIRIYIHHHSLLKVFRGWVVETTVVVRVRVHISHASVSVYLHVGGCYLVAAFICKDSDCHVPETTNPTKQRMGERERRHSTTCRAPHWGRSSSEMATLVKCRSRTAG